MAGLGLGVTMIWFSLLVLIPLIAILVQASEGGWAAYWQALTSEQTAAALRLTVSQALLVTLVNIVMGTAIAWVLVRDRFRGKQILEVVIDIPFALPTIVAGLVLLSLYGPSSPLGVDWANTRMAVFLAFLFVTLPFVVRTVQPVLHELEPEVEEAAASLGRHPVHHVPDRSSCRRWRRRSPPARRSASPAASASTGRWCCCRATCRTRPRSPRSGSFLRRGRQADRGGGGGLDPAGRRAGGDRRSGHHLAKGGSPWLTPRSGLPQPMAPLRAAR